MRKITQEIGNTGKMYFNPPWRELKLRNEYKNVTHLKAVYITKWKFSKSRNQSVKGKRLPFSGTTLWTCIKAWSRSSLSSFRYCHVKNVCFPSLLDKMEA